MLGRPGRTGVQRGRALTSCAAVAQSGALDFAELQAMASDGAVGRPMRQVGDKESPGLDAEQFAHKFSARIAREGKYQHNVCPSSPPSKRRSRSRRLTDVGCAQDVFAQLDADSDGFVSRVEMGGVTAFLTPADV